MYLYPQQDIVKNINTGTKTMYSFFLATIINNSLLITENATNNCDTFVNSFVQTRTIMANLHQRTHQNLSASSN